MPRIPTYESQLGRPVVDMPQRPVQTVNTFAGLAEGLGAVGQVAGQIAERFQQEEDNRTLMNLRLKAFKDFDGFKQGLQGRQDYQNFETEYSAFIDKWQAENLGEGINDRVYNEFMPGFGEMTYRNLAMTRADARDTQVKLSLADLDSSLGDIMQSYSSARPEDRDLLVNMANELISRRVEDGILDPLEGQKLWRGQQQRFGDTDYARDVLANPQAVLDALRNDPQSYPSLVGETRFAAMGEIERKIEAEARARQQEAASLFAITGPDEFAARANGSTTGITNDQVIFALGPERGARWIHEAENASLLTRAARDVATATPAEEQQLLDRFAPSGYGYEYELKAHEALKQAIAQKRALAEKDPGGLVYNTNSAVQQSFDQAAQSNDPEDWKKAIAASLTAQNNIGVDPVKQRPLSNGAADMFVAKWKQADNAASQFNMLYGFVGTLDEPALRGKVFAQLAQSGLPEETAYALNIARDPARRNQAQQVLSELLQKEQPDLDTATQTSLNTQLLAIYDNSDWGEMLARQGAMTLNPDYAIRRNSDLAAIKKMAGARVATGGMDVDDAIESAMDDLYGNREIYDDSDIGAVFVPRGTDLDALETGMLALQTEAGQRIATSQNLEAPYGDQRYLDLWRDGYGPRQLRFINRGEQYVLIDNATGRAATLDGQELTFSLTDLLKGTMPPKLPPLGTERIGTTSEGRPIIQNPDGSYSTERTITIEVDGRWINIPSMFGGKEVSQDQAEAIMRRNNWTDPETGRAAQWFKTEREASAAAAARSKSLDAELPEPPRDTPPLPSDFSLEDELE